MEELVYLIKRYCRILLIYEKWFLVFHMNILWTRVPEDFQADVHFLHQNIFHSPPPKDMTLQLAVKERTDCIVSDSANVPSDGCPSLSFGSSKIPVAINFLLRFIGLWVSSNNLDLI